MYALGVERFRNSLGCNVAFHLQGCITMGSGPTPNSVVPIPNSPVNNKLMCWGAQLNCEHTSAKRSENIILSLSQLYRVLDQVISTPELRSRDGHIRHLRTEEPSIITESEKQGRSVIQRFHLRHQNLGKRKSQDVIQR